MDSRVKKSEGVLPRALQEQDDSTIPEHRCLAIFDNYRLTRKNASFELDNKILPNPLRERMDSSNRYLAIDDGSEKLTSFPL